MGHPMGLYLYLNDEEATKKKSWCRAFCDDIIRYDDEKLDELNCERYKKNRTV